MQRWWAPTRLASPSDWWVGVYRYMYDPSSDPSPDPSPDPPSVTQSDDVTVVDQVELSKSQCARSRKSPFLVIMVGGISLHEWIMHMAGADDDDDDDDDDDVNAAGALQALSHAAPVRRVFACMHACMCSRGCSMKRECMYAL